MPLKNWFGPDGTSVTAVAEKLVSVIVISRFWPLPKSAVVT